MYTFQNLHLNKFKKGKLRHANLNSKPTHNATLTSPRYNFAKFLEGHVPFPTPLISPYSSHPTILTPHHVPHPSSAVTSSTSMHASTPAEEESIRHFLNPMQSSEERKFFILIAPLDLLLLPSETKFREGNETLFLGENKLAGDN